jgi:hypothetical protein
MVEVEGFTQLGAFDRTKSTWPQAARAAHAAPLRFFWTAMNSSALRNRRCAQAAIGIIFNP